MKVKRKYQQVLENPDVTAIIEEIAVLEYGFTTKYNKEGIICYLLHMNASNSFAQMYVDDQKVFDDKRFHSIYKALRKGEKLLWREIDTN